jgi:uncharacterized membrane protein YfcA
LLTHVTQFSILAAGSPSEDLSTLTLVLLAFIALAIGLVGGLVGIALGVIRLPAMVLLGVDPLIAASTNLIVSGVSSLVASWPAIREKRVAYRVVVALGVPSFIGALIGGIYADAAPPWLLLSAVAVFLVWSALTLIIRAYGELKAGSASGKYAATYDGTLSPRTLAREGVIGMIIGIVGGAVGVALGVLRMPALVQVLKMEPGLAAGTNLIITVLVSMSGFTGHLIGGNNDWTLVIVVGTAATVGMYVGSRFTGRVEPVKLRLVVGVVLLLVAPVVLLDALTR